MLDTAKSPTFRPLWQQHLEKCRHFNGLMHDTCEAGVFYETVRDASVRPYRYPCFAVAGPLQGSGGAGCALAAFPTEAEARAYEEKARAGVGAYFDKLQGDVLSCRGLSLMQPFASLIAVGAKRFETRSWKTDYRGWLAIHASKGFPRWARDLCLDEPFFGALRAHVHSAPVWWDLPVGAIVAVARLTGCFYTAPEGIPWREYYGGVHLPPPEPERSFGYYGPRQWAWRLESVRRLPEPIACRGAPRLWRLPEDVHARLEEVLRCKV